MSIYSKVLHLALDHLKLSWERQSVFKSIVRCSAILVVAVIGIVALILAPLSFGAFVGFVVDWVLPTQTQKFLAWSGLASYDIKFWEVGLGLGFIWSIFPAISSEK